MFALKVLRKDNIIKRNQVEHTRTERSVLGYVDHPFIVGLNMAFQSKKLLVKFVFINPFIRYDIT